TTPLRFVVEYTPNTIKPAKSLQFNMKDYVKAPKQTVIPAKGSTVLDLAVKMPDKSFNGVMAGGITLKEHGLSDQGSQTS
ncbi:WxL protein peptidoglycan domain-containing protein, partial [Lactiplantibacillus plantarum]|uniref:WxL protein peptidoglycan domain-containing protein n=1 Tax=Lactiplantibacillus plantarum TaxID=1590 RepID=UPI003854BB82